AESAFAYYGVKENFKITKLWCLDTVSWGWVGFWLESVTFAKIAFFYLFFKKGTFYTREEFLAYLLVLMGKRVVWEAHMGQKNFFVRSLIKRRVQMVVISQGLKNLYIGLGVREENILVAHDGVDVAQFDIKADKTEAREMLGLNIDAKIAMYTGSRYAWKGTDTLEQAGKLLPGVRVLVVSGKPYREIPLYLQAADVLVLPNSAKEEISKTYTSPMKLFEYMAAGKPIVASDVPALREVLDESACYFFAPDNAESLAAAIGAALGDPEAPTKAARAREEVKRYTWDARATAVLAALYDSRA
ncbi:MAG: glycosyltransferase family 4 protein, partial [Patescibacteria group bacterium]